MRRIRRAAIAVFCLLAHTEIAVGDDVNITAPYPNPRGVYRGLRVGTGTVPALSGELTILKPQDDGNFSLRVDDQVGDITPFVIDQAGNTGINVLSPADKLAISSNLVTGGLRIDVEGNDPNRRAALAFGTPAGAQAEFGYHIANDLLYLDHAATPDIDFVVTSVGFVGIRTTSPDVLLQVNDSPNSPGLPLSMHCDYPDSPAADVHTEIGFRSSASSNWGYSFGLHGSNFLIHGNDVNFQMRPTGESGIGPGVYYGNPAPGNFPISKFEVIGLGNTSATSNFHILDDTSVSLFYVDDAGNVGIGTTNPSAELHVMGNINANGTVYPSDVRFKENIFPLTGVLEKLSQVQAVSYARSELYESLGYPASEKRDVGVIGQELKTVFPELVHTWGEEEYLAVDYSRLNVVLLEAIKELKAMAQAQRHQIQELTDQVNGMKSELKERRTSQTVPEG